MNQSKLLNPAGLLGKTEDEAKQVCENYGYKLRVTNKDGTSFIVTADYRTDRINVSVTNGKISAINGIG